MRAAVKQILSVVSIAAGLGWLYWRQRRAQQNLGAARQGFFDECLSLLENPSVSQQGIDFPRAVGGCHGIEVQLAAVIDTLSVRKLPSLWLLVTIAAPTGVSETFDFVMRPNGAEAFTNFHRLDHSLNPPNAWPAGLVVRTDDPRASIPLEPLAAHIDFFSAPQAKELLITPKGVRLVWQLAEADRSYYGVYRQARFEGMDRLDGALCRHLIARATAISELLRFRTIARTCLEKP